MRIGAHRQRVPTRHHTALETVRLYIPRFEKLGWGQVIEVYLFVNISEVKHGS